MEEKFINSLKETLEIQNQEVLLTDKFRDYKEWDSLAQLSLIAMLDDEYNVAIENEEFMKLITVEDLMNKVISHQNK
jgi:acyl carrier protein